MYRASKALSVVQARDYYQREYSRGDYYEHDTQERKGEWYGKGAERLGLRGEVSKADFHALLEGRSPKGEQLVAAEASTDKHRAGWDFTCSADKSVSLMSLVEGDGGVTHAHRTAVDRSLAELERYVQTKDRFRDRQTTAEMVAAKFEHESSRRLDPQLHTHVVVMNMTPRKDGAWRALEPREMFAAQKLVTATYRAELARGLVRLGYPVEVRTDGSVGIGGFTKHQLDHFSQRRAQIEGYLEKRGLDGAAHAERAAKATRRAKVKDIDRDAVVEAWRARAKDQGIDFAGIRARAAREPDRVARLLEQAPARARASVTHAIEHVTERKAVFHGRDVDNEALAHGMGSVTLDDVRAAEASEQSLIDIKDVSAPSGRYTTWDMLRLEERNVALMREGQGASAPVMANEPAAAPTSRGLAPDQERVARHILTSRDQILGVEGKAGTGKTTTLAAVRERAEAAGWRVRGYAPTTGAVKRLNEGGIYSVTVARLNGEKVAPLAGRRELWVVDEAAMLSTRQTAAILERAREIGAKVVLVGDSRQHAAVEAGRPFRYLADAGLDMARLDQIRRQRDEVLRLAVRDAAVGRMRDAVSRLDQAGRVIEVKDPLERHRAIAQEVVKHPDERTLVVAPSNEERQQLNRLIRERFIVEGRVARESVKVPIALDKGLTRPELRLARSYEPGDYVRFTRAVKEHGIEPGAEGHAVAVDAKRNRVTVELRGGRRLEYDPRAVRGTSVARVEERRLARGDRIQFRAPDRDQRIFNGQFGTVREVEASKAIVDLDGGRRLELDLARPQRLDYGYASTSHAAQGQSIDRVIVCVDTERSAALVNQQQFYVSISRALNSATVFTDSRRDLSRAVSRQAEKTSALDYVRTQTDEKGIGHGTRPEVGRERNGRHSDGRAGPDGGSAGQERARARRAMAGAPDAGAPARGDAAAAQRGSGTSDAAGLRQHRAALGRDGGALPDAGGRAGAPRDERSGRALVRPGADQIRLQRPDGRSGARRDVGRVGAESLEARPAADRSRARDAGGDEGPSRGVAGREQAHPPEGALSVERRMRIREEEHQALAGLLPPDLMTPAVRLNVASRERGGERLVTPARLNQLGVEGIRRVVGISDPKQAALTLARALLSRTVDRGAEREQ